MGEAPTHVYCIICISILKKTTTFFEHSTWFNHSKKKMGKKQLNIKVQYIYTHINGLGM